MVGVGSLELSSHRHRRRIGSGFITSKSTIFGLSQRPKWCWVSTVSRVRWHCCASCWMRRFCCFSISSCCPSLSSLLVVPFPLFREPSLWSVARWLYRALFPLTSPSPRLNLLILCGPHPPQTAVLTCATRISIAYMGAAANLSVSGVRSRLIA